MNRMRRGRRPDVRHLEGREAVKTCDDDPWERDEDVGRDPFERDYEQWWELEEDD